jgi:gliding motility-associated-like protein
MYSSTKNNSLIRQCLSTFVLCLIFAGSASAQNYYDHWAFGTNVHIDFTSGTPSLSCNTSINSSEAAAVWSNPVTGDFIAYTSGNIVYNGQNHNVLSNGTGLTANASSIESALILPKPGATLDEFYIFHNNVTNCYWSEADMSASTNGTIISKNNFLQATGTERCGTAPHGSTCPAYWLMISKSGNDSVAAYLIDTSGISSTPVVTATGISGGNARGNIVFSEDFTKIGMSVENKGMYVANFDALTGLTSSWVKIGNTTNGFGSAFSPDGTKVYYTSSFGGSVYQYNFSNTTQTYIGGSGLSYLALAPDGKIYISKYGQKNLGVIASPNAAGTGCAFAISGLTIPGPSTCVCRWGLPNPFHVDIGYNPAAPDTITLCPGEDTTYTTQVNGDTFLWNTGASGASIFLDTTGLYYCTIENGDCSSSDSIYLQFVDEVEISANTVCESDTTFFSHSTPMPAGNIISYAWNFGDGNSSTLANPSHVYNLGDTFTVTFEIETQTGCVIDTFLEVIVHPNPIPEFSFSNVCDGQSVELLDQLIVGSAPIVSRAWDIENDGTTDYATDSVNHQYGSFGVYTVEYRAEDALGCIDSVVKQVYIHPNPEADFFVDNQCLNIEHAFSDSSEIDQGTIAQWDWTFGDGTTGNAQHPTHTYATAGSKTVNLVITSDSGCVDSKTLSTQVYHLPVANFSTDSVCENVTAYFNEFGATQSGIVSQYFWNFGDGATSIVSDPDHNYAGPGLFTVTHGIVSNFGCRDSIQKNIRIYPKPQTAFGWLNNVCQGDPLPFYDQSIIDQVTPGGDQIVSWDWTINGDDFGTDPNPVFQTTSYQSFDVKLTTYSNYGCSTFVENTAFIFPKPKASFIQDPNCQDYPSEFESTSTIPSGLVSDWTWDFGDGSSSIIEKPDHVYALPGDYIIKLDIVSNKGCIDSTFRALVIPETPKVKFTVDPEIGCLPLRVTMRNQSFMYNGSMSYEWYINGKLSTRETNPFIWLTNDTLEPVTYDVRLVTTSELGCVAGSKQSEAVTVLPVPKAKFQFLQTDYSMFDPSINFNNISEHSVRWKWTFGDGTTSSDFAPQHYYEKHGKYDVDLRVWNAYECNDTAHQLLVLDPVTQLYVPAAFTPNGDGDNDLWGVKGFNEGNRYNIKVWDRWGHLIIETDDMEYLWDGKLADGRLAPVGVYAYYIVYRTSDDDLKELTGQFTLVR